MATRQEVHNRRLALKQSLRTACLSGDLRPGDPAPPMRELSERFSVSHTVVMRSLQELVQEGLFHTVPRVGTFVGRAPSAYREPYLVLLTADSSQEYPERHLEMKTGFEDRIASLGGAVLGTDGATIEKLQAQGELPTFAGVLDLATCANGQPFWTTACPDTQIGRVRYGVRPEDAPGYDTVSFDDEGGGYEATRHLQESGHRAIAFIGFHALNANKTKDGENWNWSQQRENGWRRAMRAANLPTENLSFHPGQNAELTPLIESETARAITSDFLPHLQSGKVSAVVAANDYMALQLLEVLREARLPRNNWPAVVGFDNLAEAQRHLVTSLRLPWEELGAVAANILWERATRRLIGMPDHRQIAMRLIPRLTCRTQWSSVSGLNALSAHSAI